MLNRNTLFGKSGEVPSRGLQGQAAVRPPSPASTPAREETPACSDAPEPRPQPRPDDSVGSKLIVGPDIKLRGVEITDCDTLVVEGRVEATMNSRVIQIAERGGYTGTVGIDVAEVRGRFDGELTARSRLVIYATGSVSGKIRYGKIVIEEGGIVSGDVRAIGADGSSATVHPVSEARPTTPAESDADPAHSPSGDPSRIAAVKVSGLTR